MIVLQRLLRDKGAVIALTIILVYVVLGLFTPTVTFYNPNHVDTANNFSGMSWAHWLGTDHLGRDVLTRMIYAIRPSLLYVFIALIISVLIGSALGFISGYLLGYIDTFIMRLCDIMLAFPSYVITLALITLFGMGLENIILAFILTRWAWFCRVIRTRVMQYIEADHVKFAKTIGMSNSAIIQKHILPLTLADIAIFASSSMCSMILQMSGFSFLGLGVKPPTAEWGMMLNKARKVMFTHPEMMMNYRYRDCDYCHGVQFPFRCLTSCNRSTNDYQRKMVCNEERCKIMKTLLKVEQLTITDSWTNTNLVENINFTVSHGETLGIIGESGRGNQ